MQNDGTRSDLPETRSEKQIWVDNQTKLELADAWLQIGDMQAVIDLLREVIRDGDSVQKLKAGLIWTEMDFVRLGLK